jgi:hypothetical protein
MTLRTASIASKRAAQAAGTLKKPTRTVYEDIQERGLEPSTRKKRYVHADLVLSPYI